MKALLVANTDWYLYNFRIDLACHLKSQGWDVVLVAPKGKYSERFKELGFRYIPLEFSRKGINPLQELATLRHFEKIYDQEKPDLVHQFTIKCVIYGSLAAKRIGIIPIVNSITGLGFIYVSEGLIARSLRKIVNPLYRKALKGTQVIFENSDDAALFLERKFVTPDQVNIILGTGIDTKKFKPIPPPESVPLVILPSRLLWDKGVGEFVEAATMIRSKGIKARFALVGKKDEGNPSSISFEQLTQWQKEGNVEWWGWQEDILTTLSLSDIVCLPSYREGLPKVLIEAASCSRPIVTTDTAGCREVVADGVNGYLVPVKNAAELAAALEKLLLNPVLRKKMGQAGRKRAVELFANEKVNNQIEAVYQKGLSLR
jgi:glycosyltransferase involved in cell wall biosynthesis